MEGDCCGRRAFVELDELGEPAVCQFLPLPENSLSLSENACHKNCNLKKRVASTVSPYICALLFYNRVRSTRWLLGFVNSYAVADYAKNVVNHAD